MLHTLYNYCYTRLLPLLKKPPIPKVDFSSWKQEGVSGDRAINITDISTSTMETATNVNAGATSEGASDVAETPDAPAPIAVVCDEMTRQNLRREWPVVYLEPRNWHKAMEEYRPSLFFCEAAWQPPWRAQIYKDGRVHYENRRALLQVLDYCKAAGIPTVFWAKEDPTYYQHKIYNFTDTALRFDHILTTAAECVEKYKALGHASVHLWMFGYSDKIFYPPQDSLSSNESTQGERPYQAVFAGSWYEDHPKRCEDTADLFDMILEHGIPLRIYDRNRHAGRSTKPFPPKYQAYVEDAVPYEAMGDIYRASTFVLNVNTASESETMFARRVYEAMACGCIIVSNDSHAMREQFGDKVWYTGEPFDFSHAKEIKWCGVDTCITQHANGERMKHLWSIVNGSV